MICCPYKCGKIFVGAEYKVRQHTKCVDRIIRPTTMVFRDFPKVLFKKLKMDMGENNIDTQDFLDNIKSWLEIYRDARDPELIYPSATQESEIKWELGMLKIAGSFGMCDSLLGTPAQKKAEIAVLLAKTKDTSRLCDIYNLITEVEKFLGDNSK